MTFLRRLMVFAMLLIVALFCAVAVNQDAVSLRFLVWQTPQWSVFWWLLAAFVGGIALGLLFASFVSVKGNFEKRTLKKDLARSQSELHQLRNAEPASPAPTPTPTPAAE